MMDRFVSNLVRAALVVLCLLFSPLLANPLRLNCSEGSVVLPSGLHNYSLARDGARLFAAWTERSREAEYVVLVETDLENLQSRELVREASPAGTPLSPLLAVYQDHLEMAWLVRTGQGSKTLYRVDFLTLGLSSGKSLQRQSLPYGFQRRALQLRSAPQGLFLVGESTGGKREPMGLRLYKKEPEGWVPVEISSSAGAYDQQPSLIGDQTWLHLAWVRDGKICLSRSDDGAAWSDPQVLSGAGAGYPLLLSRNGEEMAVAWVMEERIAGSQIHLATSRDEGATWWHASQSIQIEGVRCEFDAGFSGNSEHFVLYHYWDKEESCEKIEFCVISSDRRRERLDRFPGQLCGRSLSPTLVTRENSLYVVWQERRGRRSSIVMNYAEPPYQSWLTVPETVLEGSDREVCVAPRLVALPGRMFLTYFVYQPTRGPIQKNAQRGDLMLREFPAEGVASQVDRIR